MSWTGIPFVRFVFALAAGIFFAYALQPSPFWLILTLATCFLMFLSLHLFISRTRLEVKPVKGIFALIFLFLAGNLLLLSREDRGEGHFQSFQDFSHYQAVITSPVEEKENFFRAEGAVERVCHQGSWKPSRGSVLLYFSKKHYTRPERGSVVLLEGMPSPPLKARNPGEFDFAAYLKKKNIGSCHFMYRDQAIFTGEKKSFFLAETAASIREYFLEKLNEKLPEKEASVAAALLLGAKNDLPEEMLIEYSSSGLMHLLAVSGLHTGIICQMLMMVLGPLRKRNFGRILFVIACISGLWMYALVTGLSASVLRAAFMFSCFLLANLLSRKPASMNTLALSAFVLLCCNPFLLFDIGFQLSYAAVAGILLVLPQLQKSFPVSGKVSSYFRDMGGMTIAAQTFTFPLGIYYFHQFPLYFLFANIAVIPVAVLSVYAGVIMLAVAEIQIAGDFCAFILRNILLFQEKLVRAFASLPSPVISGTLTTEETALVLLLALLAVLFLKRRKIEIVRFGLFTAAVLVAVQCFSVYRLSRRREIIVLHVPGHSAVARITANRGVVYADNGLLGNEAKKEMIGKNFLSYDVSVLEWNRLESNRSRILVANKEAEPLVIDLNQHSPEDNGPVISVQDGFRKRNDREDRGIFYNTFEKGALVIRLGD